MRSPFVMGIRKKEHVIGIDRWSEPDHGFRKLAKPDIVWLLPETQDSPHVFPPLLFLSPPMNLASYVVVVIIVVVIVTILSTTTMHTGSCTHPSCTRRTYSSFHIVQPCIQRDRNQGWCAHRGEPEMMPLQMEFVLSLERDAWSTTG